VLFEDGRLEKYDNAYANRDGGIGNVKHRTEKLEVIASP
jgi:hypothetical protein